MNQVVSFLKQAQSELNQVVWPTREQTVRYTILVVIVTVAVGLFLGLLDYLLTLITNMVI